MPPKTIKELVRRKLATLGHDLRRLDVLAEDAGTRGLDPRACCRSGKCT